MLLIGLAIIALLFSFTVKNEINNECNEKENYTSARKIETRILWQPEIPDGDLNSSRHFVRNFLEEAQFFSTKKLKIRSVDMCFAWKVCVEGKAFSGIAFSYMVNFIIIKKSTQS